MRALKVKAGEVPLASPSGPDRIALYECYGKYLGKVKRPAALARLSFAAVGLCWQASIDAGTAEDPGLPQLDDEGIDYDLARYGAAVARCLAGEDAVAIEKQGDALLAACFESLIPSEKRRARARGNSEAEPEVTSDSSSSSAAATSETRSPASS
jgi:hypothetical protein